MIRISQLKLPAGHSREDLEKKITKTLRIRKEALTSWTVVRRSLDARKKTGSLLCLYRGCRRGR